MDLEHLRHFPGWQLIGSYPDPTDDGVGSWLLHEGGEALLLEVPYGLPVAAVMSAAEMLGVQIRYATASHDHEDHFDPDVWKSLKGALPACRFIAPGSKDRVLSVGGEPLHLIKAPKHSPTDVVVVFRGVAVTGDIELGQLESVNREVGVSVKRASMKWLQEFQSRTGYRVHAAVSAHLNDVRVGVNWESLFAIPTRDKPIPKRPKN